jgi:PAS domain S-box-containing protein
VTEYQEDGKSVFVAFALDRTAELQVSQSAQIADALVTLSSVPIIIIDSKNRISRFNLTAEEQFGYQAQEVVGKNVRILMCDDVAQNHDAYVNRFRTKGGESRVVDKKVEVIARRKDGTTFPAELCVKEVAKQGRESSFVGYLRDITQDLVFRSNAVLCETIEAVVPDPIIVINETGIIQSFTPPACELFGYSKADVLGQNIKMLMPADVSSKHDGYLQKYQLTGVAHVVGTTRRLNGRKKNGTLVEVELRIRELTVANNQKYFVGYVRDCAADYVLVMETEMGGAIMELNPDAIISIDTKGTVQKFNAAAEKLFDFDRRHIIGRNIKVLMPDAVAMRHDQYLSSYLKSRVKRVVDGVRTVTAEKKNGETIQVEISVRQICDEKTGDPTFYIGALREVGKK